MEPLSATAIAHIFRLPLELREQIYNYVLPDQERTFSNSTSLSISDPHYCILNVICCNRQIYAEVRDLLHRRTISFSSTPDQEYLVSNIPCLHGLDFSQVPLVKFELNPFQYTTTIPELWRSLLLLCHALKRFSHIPQLQIECDGRLPRTKPPLYLDETDLDRGPLVTALLLQPFNLLHNIGDAKVTILGGPLNNLWSKNIALQNFGNRLVQQLKASDAPYRHHVINIQRLQRQLRRNPEALWYRHSYEHTFAGLVLPPYTNEDAEESYGFSRAILPSTNNGTSEVTS
ncbi:c2d81898-a4f9-4649-98fa-5c25db1ef839 [Sclerotinia trifoliorum]|uniref:C2d81898-a4f9-4649-98fa-5c25db1ef839 n=1 Tax=Sclerotinia trifoliorum TaxID=28548 RepID=A0A8H2W2F3_9HELO|nr:c2d81898-a4f9-4649-98fa-5c25db1ef839 [Sclerotinia trifoliorum]